MIYCSCTNYTGNECVKGNCSAGIQWWAGHIMYPTVAYRARLHCCCLHGKLAIKLSQFTSSMFLKGISVVMYFLYLWVWVLFLVAGS